MNDMCERASRIYTNIGFEKQEQHAAFIRINSIYKRRGYLTEENKAVLKRYADIILEEKAELRRHMANCIECHEKEG